MCTLGLLKKQQLQRPPLLLRHLQAFRHGILLYKQWVALDLNVPQEDLFLVNKVSNNAFVSATVRLKPK